MTPKPDTLRDRRGRIYTPAIGAGLRPWLWIILIGFALLAANGVYLASVTFLGWLKGFEQQTYFSLAMVVAHVALGLVFIVPFLIFGIAHLATSWKRPNRAAIRYGLMLLACGAVVLASGFVLLRLEIPLRGLSGGRLPDLTLVVRDPTVRSIGYWLHVLLPLLAIGLYVRHRLAGPRIKWHWARVWVGGVAVFVALMAVFHSHDPRANRRSNDPRYTFPSEVKLAGGKLIEEKALMMDQYCLKCHEDAYKGWFHSAHHFSSFNNRAYLESVRETRKVGIERDGSPRAARWCAGCHDPVPFFSGAFDDPKYDDVNTKSSQAGITCTACHAITHVNSTRGNADYTIEEPQHYPFAYSDNPFLQWINNTLVKAKPAMHKRTFLKPEVHRDSEFCSTCHKVHLPFALNHYKDFLRGQNHWDPFVLSGVAGGNAKSFYYPDVAKTSCNECHMGLIPSNDFAAKDFDGKPGREVHDHLFVGANTGLAAIRGRDDIAEAHAKFLADKKVRVDLFGIREGGSIDGALIAPLRPEAPQLEPGRSYLVETVVRTLAIGHPFSQGTVDSNEIWVELIAKADGRVIGRSGGIGEDGTVDPYSHFINVYMLDRHGKRIDRRNPQDIFVPLYNKQIPPGAGQVVHFRLEVPPGLTGPIELEARVNYRKFDRKYMDFVFGEGQGPALPVVVMARDAVRLAVKGGSAAENEPSPIKDTWQRWNDYGIGLLLEGGTKGAQKGELKQAEEVFRRVAEAFDRPDGWINLARVYLREGRNADALDALDRATKHKDHNTPWVINWLAAQVDERNGHLDEAIEKYQAVLDTKIPERNFDFSRDYEVRNALGHALWGRYKQEDPESPQRLLILERTIATFRATLNSDSENVDAHYSLGQAYAELGRVLDPRPDVALNPAPAGDAGQPVTPESLLGLADTLVERPPDVGTSALPALGRMLTADIVRFVNSPRPEFGSRTGALLGVVDRIAEPCRVAQDPALRASLARALSAAHARLHGLYKPDETAEGIAQKVARRDNPAADLNANSIVIHDLHRDGAPGIDGAPAARAKAEDQSPHTPTTVLGSEVSR
jgi:tetratricopeptide (TPR) repeat protein